VIGGGVYLYPEIRAHLLYQSIQITAHTVASGVSSCKTIPVGINSCGGPDEILIYSTETTNVQKLEAEIGEYNEFKKQLNERSGSVSVCSVIPTPKLTLVNNNCVVR
jgi:hypothetical protein